ncbi:hypothetical protein RLV_2213 (plasmid) [Rhizobium leguminosarum bv. viciae]|nr:hypothetical protein RLV_2213 [Rhizobium leguminosarum bv. viciae]
MDHSQAERKPEIEPNGMANHLRWKSVATIKGIMGKIWSCRQITNF